MRQDVDDDTRRLGIPAGVLGAALVAAPVAMGLTYVRLPATLAVTGGLLAGLATVLAIVDARSHRLPDRLVAKAYVVTALPPLVGAVLGDIGWTRIAAGMLAAAGTLVAYLLLALARAGGLGLGDVKLSGALGLWLGYLGWQPVLLGPLLAFLLAGTWALLLLLTRRAALRSHVALGPWMVLGAAAATTAHLAGPGI